MVREVRVTDLGRATFETPPATAQRVAEILRERIVEGVLQPGTPLREAGVAAELAVSRNTLREALRLLASDGLVSIQLHRGAVVKALTREEIRDIYIVRRTLELRGLEESAFAPQVAFDAVEAAVSQAEAALAARSWQQVGTASLKFHQALVALLGSERFNAFFGNIVAQLRLAFAELGNDEAFQSPWIPRDRHIYELLRTGQRSQAARELREYLDDSERALLDLVRSRATMTHPADPAPTVTKS